MHYHFIVQVKCTIFCLIRGLRVYFDLCEPDFPKKYLQVLFVTKYLLGQLNICTLTLLIKQKHILAQ